MMFSFVIRGCWRNNAAGRSSWLSVALSPSSWKYALFSIAWFHSFLQYKVPFWHSFLQHLATMFSLVLYSVTDIIAELFKQMCLCPSQGSTPYTFSKALQMHTCGPHVASHLASQYLAFISWQLPGAVLAQALHGYMLGTYKGRPL